MRYLSYLLRVWPIRTQGEVVWRASLESPHTGQRQGFASLKDLVIFLEQEVASRSGSAPPNADEKEGD